MSLFIGIDLGTSGCRAVAIDQDRNIHAQFEIEIPIPNHQEQRIEQEPEIWWQATQQVLNGLIQQFNPNEVRAIAIDGTSATLVLVDKQGQPVYPGILYNDSRAIEEAQWIKQVAPPNTAAQGSTSTVAKLLWCHNRQLTTSVHYVMHQADWIMAKLCDKYGFSDINNCLKLGYDTINHEWPNWLTQLSLPLKWFPTVVKPSTVIGTLTTELAMRLGLPITTLVIAGTTDSTAAVMATGAQNIGDAVTCLGSTLVLKVIAKQPIVESTYGIYSQPLLDQWLVGGASNTGGAVLLNYFTVEQLHDMTPLLKPTTRTGLDYYPLISPGERFPINNPHLAPQLTPRPQDDVQFLQGMLEGITKIERRGYELLQQLGAPYPNQVYTTGGGTNNSAWTLIRALELGIPVITNNPQSAAYGTALLAQSGFNDCLKQNFQN